MSHLKNNQNAKKPSNQVASSKLYVRCTPKQKALWVKRAQKQGVKLSEYVIGKLNE